MKLRSRDSEMWGRLVCYARTEVFEERMYQNTPRHTWCESLILSVKNQISRGVYREFLFKNIVFCNMTQCKLVDA